jgi:hypothetical protein
MELQGPILRVQRAEPDCNGGRWPLGYSSSIYGPPLRARPEPPDLDLQRVFRCRSVSWVTIRAWNLLYSSRYSKQVESQDHACGVCPAHGPVCGPVRACDMRCGPCDACVPRPPTPPPPTPPRHGGTDCSGGVRDVFGTCSGRVRAVFGRCSGGVRDVFGMCSGRVRGVFGACSGRCSGRVRGVFGACLWRVWEVFGRCL